MPQTGEQSRKDDYLPGNINICPDCMQKSFDTMNQNPGQINEMMNNMNNMPNIGMFDLSGLSNQIPNGSG